MNDTEGPQPTELNKNGYSVVSFCNRSGASQKQGMLRPFQEQMGIEKSGHKDEFFEDILRIEGSREWRRLKGIYQFDVGQSYEHQDRLTHTVDVQNVGERIGRALNLDRQSIDLTRAIAAIHDIGHMPFGHWGERAADAMLKPYDKTWTHDAAGLRVVTEWSNRGLSHEGLNLTLDTIEGLTKRYWHYDSDQPTNHFNHDLAELPQSIKDIDQKFGLHLEKHNHIEGQIASISDWVAFTATDIEDGLRVGRMTVKEICECFPQAAQLYADTIEQMRPMGGRLKREPDARQASLAKLFASQIKTMLIDDVVKQTQANIQREAAAGHLETADNVRNLDHLLTGFSPEMLQGVKQFGHYCNEKPFKRTLEAHGPLQQMVELTIGDIVEGKLALPSAWKTTYDTIAADTEKPAEQKAALTEFACTYMTCVMDDKSVSENIQQNHAEFWKTHFSEKPAAPRISPASIAKARQQAYSARE